MTRFEDTSVAGNADGGGSRAAIAPLDYQPPQARPRRRWGTGFLPAAASLYFPGLGHAFAGRRRAAIAWLVSYLVVSTLALTALALPVAAPALLLLLPASALLQLACAVHAFRAGVRGGGRMLAHPVLRYLAGASLLVATLVFHPAIPVRGYVREHWVEAFVVPTAGMAPTILPGDRVLAHKRIGHIRRWDLVVFDSYESPGQRFVQRVAGLPGETVELIGGEVSVNGTVVRRPAGVGPYANVRPGRPGLAPGGNAAVGSPMTLGPDEYFMLGDNSMISLDSRYWVEAEPGRLPGALSAGRIVARVTTIYWPASRWRSLPTS